MKQDPDLMKKYDSAFKEQKDVGIAEEVWTPESSGKIPYIPQDPLKRKDHSTTKLRVRINPWYRKSLSPNKYW